MRTQSTYDPDDTIAALSSAAGPGARAIVRLSGRDVWAIVRGCFAGGKPLPPAIRRGLWEGGLTLPELTAPLPAEVLAWPAPHTYTGQDLVELHTLASPPLVDALLAHLLRAGARPAQPGEFTLRGFLAGKLDLTQAEAVLGVIEAGGADELRTALGQLAGGVARPLQALRDDLLGLLAEVEAGLDFAEEDLTFVSRDELHQRLAAAGEALAGLREQLDRRGVSGRPFRVVLVGQPNAGKSSLFNALAGAPAALVSPEAGTTRDYLTRRLTLDGLELELVDTAGREAVGDAASDIAVQAQQARGEQVRHADLLVLCLDATRPVPPEDRELLARQDGPPILAVWTKCDLADPRCGPAPSVCGGEGIATSAVRHEGLDTLRAALAARAREAQRPSALAPSLSRCRHHVEAALDHLRHADALAARGDQPELLALELRLALDHLGELVGAVYTDDLLDRIFSQFCIGK